MHGRGRRFEPDILHETFSIRTFVNPIIETAVEADFLATNNDRLLAIKEYQELKIKQPLNS